MWFAWVGTDERECSSSLSREVCRNTVLYFYGTQWTATLLVLLGALGDVALFVGACRSVHHMRMEAKRVTRAAGNRRSWVALD